jgi:hypothetical protein
MQNCITLYTSSVVNQMKLNVSVVLIVDQNFRRTVFPYVLGGRKHIGSMHALVSQVYL